MKNFTPVAFAVVFLIAACHPSGNPSLKINEAEENPAWLNKECHILKAKTFCEVDPSILPVGDTCVYYIVRRQERYDLYAQGKSGSKLIKSYSIPVSSPFLYGDSIGVLIDSCGDERFKSDLAGFNQAMEYEPVEKVFSSTKGEFIVYQQDDNWYLLDNRSKRKTDLELTGDALKQISFSLDDSLAVFVNNGFIYRLELNTGKVSAIENARPQSYNPFIAGGLIYFSSNFKSEYCCIYSCRLDGREDAKKILASNKDLRLPRRYGNKLHFIEVSGKGYLHFSLAIGQNNLTPYNDNGVCYNYTVIDGTVIDVLATKDHSRRLMVSNDRGVKSALSNLNFGPMNVQSYPSDFENGQPYSFHLTCKKKPKGIVLYLHPGLHSDFSLRFDPILYNLAINGYEVVAYNYPGSSSYTYSYQQKDLSDAVSATVGLIRRLTKGSNLPIMILTSSSGSLLAEQVVKGTPELVKGLVSICGLSRDIPLNVPSLYLLGKQDPQVNFATRIQELRDSRKVNSKIFIRTYGKEGHWLRSPTNLDDATRAILNFFEHYLPR